MTDNPYADLEEAASILPPQGIAYIAGYLRQNNVPVSIVDGYALKLTIAETVAKMKEKNPAVIGISITSAVIYIAEELAQKIKKELPNAIVVAGGPHISPLAVETMNRMPVFDIGVIGEGELTFCELVKNLDKHNYRVDGLDEVDGIIYRKNGALVSTKPREYIKDLDILPFPAFDLLPPLNEAYTLPGDNIKRLPATSLVTSRGCPQMCTFCSRATFGRRFRAHSNEYMIRLMKHLMDTYGIRDIGFYDDNLMANPPKLRDFCKKLIEAKLDITWSCEGSVHYAKLEDLKLMRQAGCWQIAWGLESGSQQILDVFKKGVKIEQVKKALIAADQAGIDNRGFFMIGSFTETKETLEETLQFIREMPIVNFHVTYFTVYPGSEAAQDAKLHGKYMDDWRLLNSFTPNFVPSTVSRADLDRYFKKFYVAFYFRPRIIWYFIKKLIAEPSTFSKLFKSFIALTKFSLKSNTKDGK